MNTTRIAEFANLPRTTNNAEILELSQVGLIRESERSTPHMTYWELTPIGIELLDTYCRLLPSDSQISIDTLKENNRESCFKIIDALKESEKTKKALSERLGIANKELDLCLTFLLRRSYLQLD
jgi:DNA-binding IclR family transcriptional regulator